MKKIKTFGFISIFVLAFFVHPQGLFAFNVSYDQKIMINGKELATSQVLMQNGKIHAKSKFGDKTSVTIRNQEGDFTYMEGQNTATKVPPAMRRPNFTDNLADYMGFLAKQKAVLVGPETINGIETEVYQLKDPMTGGDMKTWVIKDKKFPARVEVKEPNNVTLVEFFNVNFAPAIDEKLFTVPATLQIMDISALPKKQAIAQQTASNSEKKK